MLLTDAQKIEQLEEQLWHEKKFRTTLWRDYENLKTQHEQLMVEHHDLKMRVSTVVKEKKVRKK